MAKPQFSGRRRTIDCGFGGCGGFARIVVDPIRAICGLFVTFILIHATLPSEVLRRPDAYPDAHLFEQTVQHWYIIYPFDVALSAVYVYHTYILIAYTKSRFMC